MELLIFALVVVIVAALLIWAVRSIPVPAPFSWIIQVAILVIAALVILMRAMPSLGGL
jgi:hypothetical protein